MRRIGHLTLQVFNHRSDHRGTNFERGPLPLEMRDRHTEGRLFIDPFHPIKLTIEENQWQF